MFDQGFASISSAAVMFDQGFASISSEEVLRALGSASNFERTPSALRGPPPIVEHNAHVADDEVVVPLVCCPSTHTIYRQD